MKNFSQVPQNFDLRALQILVVVAEQGGMTKAAKALNITQSGVSQTISSLEEAIGGDLFDRSKRPIMLTTAGRSLLTRANQILSDMQNAYEEATYTDNEKLAMITVAMPGSLANAIGPKLYRRKRQTSSFWRIWSGLTPTHFEEFMSYAIDMMLTEEGHIADMSGLQRHFLFEEPYILIFPKGFKGALELGPHLEEHNLIRYSSRSSLGRQIEVELNRRSIVCPKTVEMDTAASLATSVADGLGWGVTTPLCLLGRPNLIEDLVIAPIGSDNFNRRISLIARENILRNIPEDFADECRMIMREEIIPQVVTLLPWLSGKLKVYS